MWKSIKFYFEYSFDFGEFFEKIYVSFLLLLAFSIILGTIN